MAIRLLLRRQRAAVWSRAMVSAEPPCTLRFSHFQAKAWSVEGARYFFSYGGIFGFGLAGGSKNREVEDRLITLRKVMDGLCDNG
jgi:hypothetical protein